MESPEPQLRLPSLALGGGALGVFGFEGQWGLRAGAPQGWGKQRLHSWGAHKTSHALGPRAKQQLVGAWTRPTCESWRVFWREGGPLWLTMGARALVAEAPGNIDLCKLSWRLHF